MTYSIAHSIKYTVSNSLQVVVVVVVAAAVVVVVVIVDL